MKNIFKYATKELSQDAVLSWLFASWEDKELQPLVLKLLNEFGVNITADDIIDIQPLLKICKIDITIALETKKKRYLMFIEDKTFTKVHDNQLWKYDEQIFGKQKSEGCYEYPVFANINEKLGKNFVSYPKTNETHGSTNVEIVRVFYKTYALDPLDYEYIEASKNLPAEWPLSRYAGHEGWKIFDIFAICNILQKYKDTTNVILSQYIESVLDTNELTKIVEMPDGNSLTEWEWYFRNLVTHLDSDKYIIEVYNYQGKEVGITIKVKSPGCDENKIHGEQNETVGINIMHKTVKQGVIKLIWFPLIDTEEYMKTRQKELKMLRDEITRLHDTFDLPFVITDNPKLVAKCKLPTNTNDELIKSINECLKELEYIDHDLKMV